MKIGFVVHFFDFRNDVRKLISEVNKNHQVVLFTKKEHLAIVANHLPADVEARVIQEGARSLRNRIWQWVYLFLKRLPKSKNNFYLMEYLKASNSSDYKNSKKGRRNLWWIMRLPKVMSYDYLLSKLSYSGETPINDIDQLIFFTEISDDVFLSRALKEIKKVKVYVYSWDHACKQTRFSAFPEYMVWSKGVKVDLQELQSISSDKIQVTGSSQFAFIHDFLNTSEDQLVRTYPFDYIYFGCAVGIRDLVVQETTIIKTISAIMATSLPSVKLVVRPYPVLKDWSLYEDLMREENIIFDDGFRSKDLSMTEASVFEKLEKIHFAKAFIHVGTTMGLEASFSSTPSYIVDFGYDKNGLPLNIVNFIHQYQNDKYLIEIAAENVLGSEKELERVLSDLDDPKYLLNNGKISEEFRLRSFTELAETITV